MQDPKGELHFDDTPSDTKPESMDEEKGSISPQQHLQDGAVVEQPAAPVNVGGPGGAVPNGGLQAWLQVFCSFLLFFNTWGILNNFGVFQTYYESGALFAASSSDISWIGSLQSVMVLMVGAVTGPIYDRGYLRVLLGFGAFMIVFGHMMLSLCHTYYQALLAQGLVIGIGAGCLFVPAVAILPGYFDTKLGLAIGLGASGSSTGGIIFPIMFYKLVGEVGFPWAVRIIGFTVLATLSIPLVIMKMRVKPGRVRSIIDWTVFTDWPFVLFTLACLVGFITLYTGLFYTSYFGASTGITDASLSFYLVPILNAGSVFGRTIPNYISDIVGPFNVIAPGAIVLGIVVLCNLVVHNVGGLVVTTLLFGFCSGIFVAMPTVLFVVLTKDKTKIGTRIGMGFAFLSLGVLAGGPGAGAILGDNPADLNWNGVWIYGGIPTIASGFAFAGLRVWRTGFKLMVKA